MKIYNSHGDRIREIDDDGKIYDSNGNRIGEIDDRGKIYDIYGNRIGETEDERKIYNSRENKVEETLDESRSNTSAGDIIEGIPFGGSGSEGCLLIVLVLFVGLGSVLIWPAFFLTLGSFGDEIVFALLWFALAIGALLFCAVKNYRNERFTFLSMWVDSVSVATCVAGIGSWLVSSAFDGFSLWSLLGCLFISFLLSISGGFITSLIVLIARKMKNVGQSSLH